MLINHTKDGIYHILDLLDNETILCLVEFNTYHIYSVAILTNVETHLFNLNTYLWLISVILYMERNSISHTLPPFIIAALVSVVAQLAGSMVPSPGLCSVPYKSSTFNNGYNSLDSLGPKTNDSTPYTFPSCLVKLNLIH